MLRNLEKETVQIVAHIFGPLAGPRVVGQNFDKLSITTPGATMETIGTKASPVITELKEAFRVDEGRVKSFLEEKMRGAIEKMMNQMLYAEEGPF